MLYFFFLLEFKVCILLSNLYVYILVDKEYKVFINKKKGVKLWILEGVDLKEVKFIICFNFIFISKLC